MEQPDQASQLMTVSVTAELPEDFARDIVTAWLHLPGLREALATVVADGEGHTWADLHDDEQAAFLEVADSLVTRATEWSAK